jgi:tRNA(Ile)-lysidine synthase
MKKFSRKIRQTVERFSMLQPADRVVVAVSGGADSVCLLHCLVELAPEYNLELLAAHFNHQLRGGESDEDQRFVEDLCARLGVELKTGTAPVREIAKNRKGSLEEICRERRHGFLLSLMRERGYTKIALGHNLDDQAETVLMNVIRGAGIDGLKGIDPARDCYIRPLLEVARDEIAEFLAGRQIPFRSDSSNLDNSFRRNSVRNSLIPEIRKKYNPSISAALGRLAGIAREENSFLDRAARKALDRFQQGIKLDEFLRYDPALRSRIIKTALEGLSPVKGGISHEHIAAAAGAIEGANPSAEICLPYGIFVRREYGYAVIGRADGKGRKSKDHPEYNYTIDVPRTLFVREIDMEFRFALLERLPPPEDMRNEWKAFMDFSSVAPPLVIRNLRPGDRIQPFGMKGSKKLQDVLTDRKIPRARRREIPVLADSESVLWVPGIVRSERMRTDGGAGRILSVERI